MAGFQFKVDAKAFARDLEKIDKRMRFAGEGAEHTLAVQMAKDTDQYTPASGAPAGMHNRVIVHEDTIIYPGPYARFLYYGKLMIDPKTGSPFAAKGASKVVTGKNLNISQKVHGKAQSHWFEASKAQNLDKWRRVAGKAVQREFRK